MKKLFWGLCVSILVWNCGPGAKKEVAATVDAVYASQDSTYLGKDVTLTGTCIIQVCEHSGATKAFLKGTDENKLVVLVAGEGVTFSNDMDGKTLSVKGVISNFDMASCCKHDEEELEADSTNTVVAPDAEATETEEGHKCAAATKKIAYKMDCSKVDVVATAAADDGHGH